MAGLGSGDGERNRFQIAHFADHDDIGILAERAAQRRCERAGMRVHFALGDVATFWFQHILDRIFEGDDVLAPLDVRLLDQSRERGRFSTADRAGDENQSVLITREEFEMLGQTELVHRLHLCVNDAKNEIDPEPLAGNAGAIPAECIRVGKIRVAPLVQMRFVQAGKKTFCERERLVRGETRSVGPNRLQRSVQPPKRRRVYAKMNIRRAGTLSDGQVFIDMRQRMRLGRCRCWGHGVPRFLCSATARVNSKGFRPGTAA